MEAANVMYEREKQMKQMKQFEATKAGVKGLVDSGESKLPTIFVHSQSPEEDHQLQVQVQVQIPVIDLSGLTETKETVINGIKEAAEKWGFFQIINHGIPLNVMEDMLEAGRRFHEQPQEAKKDLYSRDYSRKAIFYSNMELKPDIDHMDWRDTLRCHDLQDQDESSLESIPQVCRREMSLYSKCLLRLRHLLSELLSEALGLGTDYIATLGCLNSMALVCQYYPVCPQPHLTLGTSKHADMSFITILLQDTTGGLQVLHDQNHWVHVKPLQGALIVNIGDMMQLISNDKMKSVQHRVLAAHGDKARVSVACFLSPDDKLRLFGPIKELVSENSPSLYKQTSYVEFVDHYFREKAFLGSRALPHFKTNLAS